MKYALKKVWNAVTTVVVILIVILALLLVGVRLIGFQVFTVLSGSMEPAYMTGSLIYVKEVDPFTLADGDVITFMLDEDTEAWTLSDGWYYYNAKLEPSVTAEPLFTTVTFPDGMGNEWQNAVFHIAIDMQAVQVANNGATVLEAAGWPATTP